MHAAAMKPGYTEKEDVPQEALEQAVTEAKDLALQKAREGMPEKAKEQMLKGIEKKAIQKLYKTEVLMEQELATSEQNQTIG